MLGLPAKAENQSPAWYPSSWSCWNIVRANSSQGSHSVYNSFHICGFESNGWCFQDNCSWFGERACSFDNGKPNSGVPSRPVFFVNFYFLSNIAIICYRHELIHIIRFFMHAMLIRGTGLSSEFFRLALNLKRKQEPCFYAQTCWSTTLWWGAGNKSKCCFLKLLLKDLWT